MKSCISRSSGVRSTVDRKGYVYWDKVEAYILSSKVDLNASVLIDRITIPRNLVD